MNGISHVFFDIGGVLATNGWDSEQRGAAAGKFDLDREEFETRHDEMVGLLEQGQIGIEEYLDVVVFYEPRNFSRAEFREFIFSQSRPFTDTIEIARAVAAESRYWMMTMNNEGEDLNRYRIEKFGLDEIFDAFLSSCWLGFRKPARAFYERALGISGAHPRESLLIEDRIQNIAPARGLGMQTIHYTSATQLARELRELGVELNLNGEAP